MDQCQSLSSPQAVITSPHQLFAGKHVNKMSHEKHKKGISRLVCCKEQADGIFQSGPKDMTDSENRKPSDVQIPGA